ncbi:MAG TPA: SLBB domain-containing protein [Ignavibacteria bacterium]|nr:SLBB domain-containing protein [Ignavibacteria bacterium]
MKKFLILLLVAFPLFVSAQTGDPLQQLKNQSTQTTQTQTGNFKINADAPELFGSISDGNVHSNTVPLEGAINPNNYIIGPNDLFTLGLYGFINQQVPLYVSPEGSVIIPTVGEVKVNGLTLAEAKSRVVAAVKKRYYSSDVSFTLTMPRTFLVKVTGLTQGTFEVMPTMRASEILKRLYFDSTNVSRVSYDKMSEFREQLLTQMSMRNIELQRKDGSVKRVDIYKFFQTNNDDYNPFFLEGDLLKVPNTLLQKNYVTIDGAVQLAGTYEYAVGDDLETLIGLGRGFDMNAEPDSIILYRPEPTGKNFDLINLDYDNDKNFQIKNYDRVFVKYKTDYQKKVTVLVLGEVQRPGYYPITFKNTRVKDAVEMAGGITENAYLPLSIVFRNYDKEYALNDTADIRLNQRANDLIISEKDRDNFWNDILSRRGRLVIDFERLYKNNDENQNFVLEDGDIIYINDDKKIVYVYGSVQNEGYVAYKKGADAQYYIDMAGGFAPGADDGNTRVIKFNSRGWYKPDETEVQTGDFVYVPKEAKDEFKDTITLIAQISGVLLGIVTTFILIRNNQ